MSGTGHNSGDAHGIARDQLLAFVQRIERLDDEAEALSDDRKDVYGEAKGVGFDVKALKRVVAIRRQDRKNRSLRLEQEAIVETYMQALGMIDLPPGED